MATVEHKTEIKLDFEQMVEALRLNGGTSDPITLRGQRETVSLTLGEWNELLDYAMRGYAQRQMSAAPAELIREWHDATGNEAGSISDVVAAGEAMAQALVDQAKPAPAATAPRAELVKALCYLYWSAYHSGHHDTVEGQYIDVLHIDGFTYHEEAVMECLKQTNCDLSVLAEDARDAQRYRWLRAKAKRSLTSKKHGGDIQVFQWDDSSWANALYLEALDAAIDKARLS